MNRIQTKYNYFVYCIENTTNNKFYVGVSYYNSRRKNNHFRKLRNNRHENDYLQNAWNKYGKDAFEFKIIEMFEDKNKASDAECFWIDTLQSMSYQDGYNIQHGGYDGKLVETTKKKIRNKITKLQGKSVSQFDLDGNFIATYPSISAAAKEVDTYVTSISNCCQNKKHYYSASGYQWFFTKDVTDEKVEPYINHEHRKFSQYNLQGNIIKTFDDVKEASKKLNIGYGTLYGCLNGRNDTCVGYQWEYGTREKIQSHETYITRISKTVGQFLKNGCLVGSYDSLTEAARITNSNLDGISKCVNNNRKTSNGYRWRLL